MNTDDETKPAPKKFPRPMFDRIIVKPIEEPMSKIITQPEKYKDKPEKGFVIATGPGGRSTVTGVTLPMVIKPGMTVIFTKYTGTPVHINGEEFLVLHETDVHYYIDYATENENAAETAA